MTSLRPRYLTVFAPAVLSFGAAATEPGAGIASLVIPVFGVAPRAADPTGGPFAAAGAVLATAPVVLLTRARLRTRERRLASGRLEGGEAQG